MLRTDEAETCGSAAGFKKDTTRTVDHRRPSWSNLYRGRENPFPVQSFVVLTALSACLVDLTEPGIVPQNIPKKREKATILRSARPLLTEDNIESSLN